MTTPAQSLRSTIDADEAARGAWDVAVVGAGPAGAIAARMCALRGARVLLIDRAAFPRYKVCGGCLNGAALAALQAAGLGRLVDALGATPLTQVTLATGGRMVTLPIPRGAAISREALDAALIREAAAAGTCTLLETAAALLPGNAGGVRRLSLRPNGAAGEDLTAAARVVIAADGLGGRLLAHEPAFQERISPGSRIGAGAMLPADAPELARFQAGTIYMSAADGGYVGVTRVEDGRYEVAAALDASFVRRRRGLGAAVAAVMEAAGHGRLPALAAARWRGTPELTRRRWPLGAERVLVVGDAAGYIEPFTGEGMAWALGGGVSVADAALSGVAGWSPRVAARWEAAHARLILRRQSICRGLAFVLRRGALRGLSLRLLAPFPKLAWPIVSRLNEGFARLPGIREDARPAGPCHRREEPVS